MTRSEFIIRTTIAAFLLGVILVTFAFAVAPRVP